MRNISFSTKQQILDHILLLLRSLITLMRRLSKINKISLKSPMSRQYEIFRIHKRHSPHFLISKSTLISHFGPISNHALRDKLLILPIEHEQSEGHFSLRLRRKLQAVVPSRIEVAETVSLT